MYEAVNVEPSENLKIRIEWRWQQGDPSFYIVFSVLQTPAPPAPPTPPAAAPPPATPATPPILPATPAILPATPPILPATPAILPATLAAPATNNVNRRKVHQTYGEFCHVLLACGKISQPSSVVLGRVQ